MLTMHTLTAFARADTACMAPTGEIGFSAALEELSSSLFNGKLPPAWARLNPATEKPLGPWMAWFVKRHEQYKVNAAPMGKAIIMGTWPESARKRATGHWTLRLIAGATAMGHRLCPRLKCLCWQLVDIVAVLHLA